MVWCNALENWYFLIFKVHFQCQNSTESFRKWFSVLNMWIVEQLSSRTFYHYLSFWSTLLVKMCPIFDGSASNHFTRYQKILWVCSLECKKLLNFICLLMKFHNRVYLTIHPLRQKGRFLYLLTHCEFGGAGLRTHGQLSSLLPAAVASSIAG